ncbi:DUF4238 domain-containing protein [Mesorhizobium sp. M0676]|uniref:DUF4238 domain-containing protein n=1 Tax=Mesorhizobium sp. M0676 TaxID=2956984 RepID=UPI00333BB314
MAHLTKRQHYVPVTYLESWAGSSGRVALHDLEGNKCIHTAPENALAISWYYEEDPTSPDNRVEAILSAAEGKAATSLRKLIAASSAFSPQEVARNLNRTLTVEDETALKEFACYQYLRVPGAIEQKAFELQTTSLTEEEKRRGLNPGYFTESGFDYVLPRFRSMNSIFYVSEGTEFITSDWPCFDISDSDFAPALGEEVGVNPGVVTYCPLAPRITVLLVHREFSGGTKKAPRGSAMPMTNQLVRNQNALVIQRAVRWVVASKDEPFIFKAAGKRVQES